MRARAAREATQDTVIVVTALLTLILEKTPTRISPTPTSPCKDVASVHDRMICSAQRVMEVVAPGDEGNAGKKKGGGRSKRTMDDVSDMVIARLNAIKKDKPVGLMLDKHEKTQSSVLRPWAGFRPSVFASSSHPSKCPADEEGSVFRMLIAAQRHIQTQPSLILGFNRMPTRNANACCMHSVALDEPDAWSLLSAASRDVQKTHADVIKRFASDASNNNRRKRVKKCPEVAHGKPRWAKDGWIASGAEVTVESPTVVPPLLHATASNAKPDGLATVIRRVFDASPDDGVFRTVYAKVLQGRNDMQMRGAWSQAEAAGVQEFHAMCDMSGGVSDADRADLLTRYMTITVDSGAGLRDIRNEITGFVRADLAPVLIRMSSVPNGRFAKRALTSIDELLARVAAHEPVSEVAAARAGLKALVAGVSGKVWKALGQDANDDEDTRNVCIMTARLCVATISAISKIAIQSPRLTVAMQGISGLLVVRWIARMRFNRRDVDATEDDLIKHEREAKKAEILRAREGRGADAQELEREFRDIWGDKAGKRIMDAMAFTPPDPEDTGKSDDVLVAGPTKDNFAEPEDAMDYYWSNDEDDGNAEDV